MYADIIIDITHEKLDKVFQYRVPEALEVRYTQSERAYWEAGGCWEIYVEIDADKKVVAAASVDAETGELTRNILTYNGSGYWEAE